MSDELDKDDWDRIAHALEQFRHNPLYLDTFQKVRAILAMLR